MSEPSANAELSGTLVISDQRALTVTENSMADPVDINAESIEAGTAANTNSNTSATAAAAGSTATNTPHDQQTINQQNNAMINTRATQGDTLFQQMVTQQNQLFTQTMQQQNELFAKNMQQVEDNRGQLQQLFNQSLKTIADQNTATNNNNLLAFYAASGAITIIP